MICIARVFSIILMKEQMLRRICSPDCASVQSEAIISHSHMNMQDLLAGLYKCADCINAPYIRWVKRVQNVSLPYWGSQKYTMMLGGLFTPYISHSEAHRNTWWHVYWIDCLIPELRPTTALSRIIDNAMYDILTGLYKLYLREQSFNGEHKTVEIINDVALDL